MSRYRWLPERAVRKAVVLSDRGVDLTAATDYYQRRQQRGEV